MKTERLLTWMELTLAGVKAELGKLEGLEEGVVRLCVVQ